MDNQEKTGEQLEKLSGLSKSGNDVENLFQLMLKTIPVPVFLTSKTHLEVDYINPCFTGLFGYTLDDVPTIEKWMELAYPDETYRTMIYQETYKQVGNAANDNSLVIQTESSVTCKDGSIKQIFWQGYILDDRMLGCGVDLTQQKQNERDLQKAKAVAEANSANITAIIEGTKESIWAFNNNYEILYINKTFQLDFEQTFGIWLEPGVNLIESHPEPIRSIWKTRYDKVLANEQFTVEDSVDTENGKLYVQITFNPIAKNGEVIGGSCIGSNITNRKLAELELIKAKQIAEESERLHRKMNENSPLGMHFYQLSSNNQLVFVGANPAADQILGVNHNQFIGKTIEEAFPPLIHTEVPESYRNAAENGISWATEQITYDDKKIVGAFAVRAFQTTPGNMVAIFADITKRKEAEEKLQTNEASMVSAIKATGLCIYEEVGLESTNRQMTFMDNRGQFVLGIPDNQMFRARDFWIEHIHPEDLQNILIPAIKDFEYSGIDVVEAEYRYQSDELGLIWLRHVAHAIQRNDKKEILHLVGAFQDITERKITEIELLKAKEHAEESDRLKSAFLANMSHEIRSPLNSIIGFSELIIDPDFETEQHSEFAQLINENGNNLLTVISDIMDISKIEAGQLQVKIKEFSVNQLISSRQKEFSFKAVKKGIELRLAPSSPNEGILIQSDSIRIIQILNNLINNAIKFTEKGFVEIGFISTGEFIQFHVRDTGIGIPAKYHDQIFERFRQVESAFSRKYGGNGLGLPISKSLVELLGGKIWMESEEGKGTTFFFTVPATCKP